MGGGSFLGVLQADADSGEAGTSRSQPSVGLHLPRFGAQGNGLMPGMRSTVVEGDEVNLEYVGVGVTGMGMEGPSSGHDWQDFGPANNADHSPVNTAVTASLQRKVRHKVDCPIPQLSGDSISDISDYETKKEEDANSGEGDLSGVKHVYRDETWSIKSFTYDPKPKDFKGRMGSTKFFVQIPSNLILFELFWPFNVIRKIVIETNHYATHVIDALGNTRGGPK
jgi:hypothetical protein